MQEPPKGPVDRIEMIGCQRVCRAPRRKQAGQALVEFAIVSTILLLLVAGAIDFGNLYSQRLELDNAARVGVRYAADNPKQWTNTASPADNTIEGQIIYAGGTLEIPNDDAHISIKYYTYDKTTQTKTYCGYYSVASNSYQTVGGVPQSSCVIPGSLIGVTVLYDYTVLTPVLQGIFGATVRVQAQTTMVELK
jgi:Flp pilus assembly protein TadG